jgi:hypothetical protein
MRHFRLIAAFCILSLAACAELGREACEDGDWLMIGQRDGSRGRDSEYIERHVRSCGKYDVGVDRDLWEQGRQRGLRVFCTPQSQYQAGRDGRPFNEICAKENLPVHREAFEKGRKYHTLTQRIEMLRAEMRDLRREAVASKDPNISRASLEFEAFMLRMDIDILLRERRKYESL